MHSNVLVLRAHNLHYIYTIESLESWLTTFPNLATESLMEYKIKIKLYRECVFSVQCSVYSQRTWNMRAKKKNNKICENIDTEGNIERFLNEWVGTYGITWFAYRANVSAVAITDWAVTIVYTIVFFFNWTVFVQDFSHLKPHRRI